MLNSMKKWYVIGLGSFVAVGGMIIIALLLGQKPPIPRPIKQQVTSTILAPKSSSIVTDRESVKYDTKIKLLTYNAQINEIKVVVSQQPTPENFTDIPQVYDKMVEGMSEYLKFDVAVGTVHLTRPKELAGKQAAVLNTKGTLMFAKPDKDLSDDQWRKFFNSLDIVR
jgi:hypothetical protein